MGMDQIRTSNRLVWRLMAAGVLIAVFFGFVAPASAKGPESVTIRGPGLSQPMDLMAGAGLDQVSRLMEQMGLWYGTGDLPEPIAEPPSDLGAAYTLTWVNGGPPGLSRTQRTIEQFIYLDAQDGPVIHTPAQDSLEGWGPGVIGWFRAPEGLRETLAGLGMPHALSEGRGSWLPGPLKGSVRAVFQFLNVAGPFILVGLAFSLGAWQVVRRRQRHAAVD